VYELALFAGAGGGLLATKWLLGFRTVCYVENAAYPVEILKARIRDGWLDDAPIWGDARTFDGRPWRGCVDIVTAGFPCQPFSSAGRRLADRDERNLWPDTIRIIREIRPNFALLENVPALLYGSHGYFGRILGDLAESGYDARWRMLSAAEVGAPHRRDRIWILAYSGNSRQRTNEPEISQGQPDTDWSSASVANAYGGFGKRETKAIRPGGNIPESRRSEVADPDSDRELQQGRAELKKRGRAGDKGQEISDALCPDGRKERQCWRFAQQESSKKARHSYWWAIEPNVGRVVDGMASRVDRLRALGNGQVPTVAAVAWDLLTADWFR
jgi:DNA (cytosine-5)-methyltransferase 1